MSPGPPPLAGSGLVTAIDSLEKLNKEIPANPSIEPSEDVKAWGAFKADQIEVETTGRLQLDAVKLMDNANYK